MRRRPKVHVGTTVLVLVLLGACGSPQEPSGAPSRTASPSAAANEPAPSGEPSAPDVVSAPDRDVAVDVAVAAMADFTARDRPYEAWWVEFSAHLTPEGVQAYEFTDPARVPASEVTDAGQFAGGPDGTSAAVLVGTDVGQYRVELVRQSVLDAWLVDRLTPPQETS